MDKQVMNEVLGAVIDLTAVLARAVEAGNSEMALDALGVMGWILGEDSDRGKTILAAAYDYDLIRCIDATNARHEAQDEGSPSVFFPDIMRAAARIAAAQASARTKLDVQR